jgi:FkbM family methyltransferase
MRTDPGMGLRSLARRLHRRVKALVGRDLIVPLQEHRVTEYHGTSYGGWAIVPDAMSPATVVYSAGVGDDVSFDLSLIKHYGLTVHAFDPTPRSIAWVRSQSLPAQFVFHEIGVGHEDGTLTLFPPARSSHISFSVVNRTSTVSRYGLEFPVRRLSTIMRELGHERVDVLKMDIEGAEYSVLRTLDEDGIYPTQILVEFHHRFFPDGIARTRAAIQCLNKRDYRLVALSPSGEEYTFLRLPP